MELSQEQINEIARLKAHFPYRIIYGVMGKEIERAEFYAVTNMRIPNKLVRQGYDVFTFKT